MAVAFDANSPAFVDTNGTSVPSLSVSLTVGTGTDRALTAEVVHYAPSGGYVSGVTWTVGSTVQNLSPIVANANASAGFMPDLWGLVNPTSGNGTLTATFSPDITYGSLNAQSFTGADQTGGTTTFYNATLNTGTTGTPSTTITSAAGDMAVDAVNATALGSPTQTQTYLDTLIGNGGSRASGAASVTFAWSGSTPYYWAQAVTAIRAAPSSGGGGLPQKDVLIRGLFVGGQSQMANFTGPSIYTITHPTQLFGINPSTDALAPLTEPMAGVDGTVDSFIPQLADDILTNLSLSALVVGDIAIGGTAFAQWAKGGAYNAKIPVMLADFAKQGVKIGAVIWGEGEQDATIGTSEASCVSSIISIVETFRDNGHNGPIFFALETWQNGIPAGSTAVRAAITAVAGGMDNVFVGPDLDTLGSSYRQSDNTHFNAAGEAAVVALWYPFLAPVLLQ